MRCALLLTSILLPVWCAGAPGPAPAAPLRGCPVTASAALGELPPPVPDGQLEIVTPRAEVDLNASAIFPEGLELHFGNRLLSAPHAEWDSITGNAHVSGDVIYRDPATWVHGTEADFFAADNRVEVRRGDFELVTGPARGTASRITLENGNQLRLTDVLYTTCAVGHDDWVLKASSITVDGNSGLSTARNARLEFQGIPIFYTPWISYPIYNQRTSGFLLPNFGSSGQRGFEFDIPWYLNIAPNYDATFTPRVMSRRGFQLDSEFRYLLPNHDGEFHADLLPHDDVTGDTRYLLGLTHQSLFAEGWRLAVNARTVSDKNYFADLSSTLAASSQTFLERRVDVEYLNDFWSLLMRVQDYQTLDEIIGPADKPYVRLPELAARGTWADAPLGTSWTLDSDFTYFHRDEGVRGSRLHLAPELTLPLRFHGVHFEPTVALDFTRYGLTDTAAGQPKSPVRTVPIYSADLSAVFERALQWKGNWLQTIEPRALYVYIPFRRQDDLPVFDTVEPDFNLVQLFRKNRFAGLDRIGDTSQLSAGLTSRVIDAEDGTQLLNATVGQTRYFSTLDVTLPGGTITRDTASNYVAELGLRIQRHLSMDLGYQWNTDAGVSQLAEARIQYLRDRSRVLTLGYRYRKDTLDEIEVAGAWPLSERWSVIGRYDYSLLDHEQLEGLFGLEYQNCCWGLRFSVRRHLASRDGTSDTAVSVQLVLKGLGSNTEPADRLLERGILGYERN